MKFNISSHAKYKSGIYIITNSIDKRVYVGSAVNLYNRYHVHKTHLNQVKHSSKHLQRFVSKYGIESISFNLLETCEKCDLIKREQYHLDYFQSYQKENGFNLNKIAGSNLGMIVSEETRKKLSLAHKGKVLSQAIKDKIRITTTGRKAPRESVIKSSLARIGKKRTKLMCQRIAEGCKKKPKKDAWNKGMPMPEHVKQAVINAHKGKPAHNRLKVAKYSLAGIYIETYNSTLEAAKSVNGCDGHISAVCKGKRKKHKGFLFRYVNNQQISFFA